MTQIPLPPHLFWPLLIGAFVVLPLLILSQDSHFRFGKLQAHLGLGAMWKPIFALSVFLWSIILALVLLGLGQTIFEITWATLPQAREEIWDFRFAIALLAGLVATLGGVLALPFTLIRLRLTQEANDTTEQGLITDRINSAVDGLGAKRTVKIDGEDHTEPNIEVRIGALLALERIARQNLDFHIQIMEILCAYVRQNAPADVSPMPHRPRSDVQMTLTIMGRRDDLQKNRELSEKSQNSRYGYRLCLQDCNLNGADLSSLDFSYALLEGSSLYCANLSRTNFSCADLTKAHLQEANLTEAVLARADLTAVNLNFCNLFRVNFNRSILKDAYLFKAVLIEANLVAADIRDAYANEANFERATIKRALLQSIQLNEACLRNATLDGTNLAEAQLTGADFRHASLRDAELCYANLERANLSYSDLSSSNFLMSKLNYANLSRAILDTSQLLKTENMKGAAIIGLDFSTVQNNKDFAIMLHTTFGDSSVALPKNMRQPPSWPRYALLKNFDEEWRLWALDQQKTI